MDLHEYQGKQFFASYGIPVSPGEAVTTVDDAVAAGEKIGYPVVVKAQVQVGGRGKAGGVKLANDADEVRLHAGNILGMDIKGHRVETVWIELASDIAEEYYASFTLDRSAKKHLGMLSAQGGVEIEAVAETDPDAIAKVWIDPVDGLTEAGRARPWVAEAKLNPAATDGTVDILLKLYTRLHRGRRRPLRDQPADPQAHRRGPRPRRQGHPRRQRRSSATPSTSLRGHPGARRRASRPPTTRACSTSGLDGSVGVIANGAGLAMSTRRHRQPGRREAGQLPRHRWRRQRRRDGRGARGHQQRPGGEVDLHQHLRRASPRATRWPTASSPPSGRVEIDVADRHPPRRHQRRRGPGDPASPTCPTCSARSRPWSKLPKPSSPLPAPGSRSEPRWRSSSTTPPRSSTRASPARQGKFYGLLNKDYGTQVVAGTNPKKAGTDVEGIPVYATVADAVEATGATASCIFIPAPGVRRRRAGGGRGRRRVHRGHHRGRARPGRGLVLQQAQAGLPRHAAARPELPGHHQPRQVQHRHHRRRTSPRRPSRAGPTSGS